jgi:putative metal-binding protein
MTPFALALASALFGFSFAEAVADDRAAHDRPSGPKPTSPQKAGEISGVIAYCGTGGNAGILVHLPGRSFQAKLGPNGRFILNYVPEGSYSLAVEIPGRASHTVTGVVVDKDKVTSLGTIEVCRDGDGDLFTEAQDCNDNNPNIFPGAAEPCDGLDNDCDGVVDESCAACTDADHDGFFAQAGCQTAIDCSDSDATIRPTAPELCDAVDNDCDGQADEDFDLATDAHNCGSCGNVCGAGASCESGQCTGAACDPDGVYTKSGAPIAYTCCSGLINISVSTFIFSNDGAAITTSPSAAVLVGAATTCANGAFDNSNLEAGGCTVTQNLAGSFGGPNEWTGTYSLQFTGADCSCFGGLLGTPCTNASFPVSATR